MEAASISEADYHAMKAAEMSEKRLQDNVLGVARTLGWRVYHTYSSVRSEPGYPDLHLVHARHKVSALVELKTMKGKLSPAQQTWLRDLHAASVAVAVWRPIHWYTHQIHDWLANPRTVDRPGRLA